MKTAYHYSLHALGLGCVAACVAIVATMGGLDIHWSGWIAVAFFALLAAGILVGWFPWRGQPIRVMIKGFYVMSALALIGFGFDEKDPWRAEMWMVLAGLAAAIAIRIVLKIIFRLRDEGDEDAADKSGAGDDPLYRA